MQIAVTLVAPPGETLDEGALAAARGAAPSGCAEAWLDEGAALDLVTDIEDAGGLRAAIGEALEHHRADWSVQPLEGRRKHLLVSDMDSTIIGQECIDEVAEIAGVRDEVAGITARAMAGEIDFEAALKERVALLDGIEIEALKRVYQERVTVNDGAATLVSTMRGHGARTLLVSGGFTFFAAQVAEAVGFDAYQANRLMVEVGRLTGLVAEPILGRDAKAVLLLSECERLGINPTDAVAIGDGANDLALVETAGLGIAYRAKPVLAARANARIGHGDLTAALHFQGYRRSEFAAA